MPNFVQAPPKPVGKSRFKDYNTRLNTPIAEGGAVSVTPRARSSKKLSAKASSPKPTQAVRSAQTPPPAPKPSAEEIRRRKVEDARIDRQIAESLERKKARDIRRMWSRAMVKCGRKSSFEEGARNVFADSVVYKTDGLTGQAKTDAFLRAVQEKMVARGQLRG